tara:strand:- start:4568 stop:4792 length:225 start_codon:yes stop_codon:yes gene_type:complete
MKIFLILACLISLTACESKEECEIRLKAKSTEARKEFKAKIRKEQPDNPLMWGWYYEKAVKNGEVFKYKSEMCE